MRDKPAKTARSFFSVSYASLTADYLLDGYQPGRPTEFSYANRGTPGALCITYKYMLKKRIAVGVTATIEQQYGDWLDNEIPDGNVFDLQTTVKGAFVRTCYTLGADLTYDYVATSLVRLYLVAGLGFTYEFETDQYNPSFYDQGYRQGVNEYGPMRSSHVKSHVNMYASPLGLSVGRKLRYFFELGFGYRGVVNTGLAYGFNTGKK